MDAQSKPGKSTGSLQPIRTEKEKESAPLPSTKTNGESPVLPSVHSKGESVNSTGDLSVSKILALQILLADFKQVRREFPESKTASSNGKIYWCIEAPGHDLKLLEGNLLVDGKPVDWEKLLAKGQ